jgi:hypothetical protein
MGDTEAIEAIERYFINLTYDIGDSSARVAPWFAVSEQVNLPVQDIVGRGLTAKEAIHNFLWSLNLKTNHNNSTHGVNK